MGERGRWDGWNQASSARLTVQWAAFLTQVFALTMTELYRFRTMDQLFGNRRELEEQNIYFASPEELNDPMEGFRDIFWRGDRTVWINLFRNYLYCLNITFIHARVFGNSYKIEPKHIPVMGQVDQPLSSRGVRLFDDICKRVFQKAHLLECAARIADTNRKARHDEVLFYLRRVHRIALIEIQDAHAKYGLASENKPLLTVSSPISNKLIETRFFERMQQVEDERFLDVFFPITNRYISDGYLVQKYDLRSESQNTFGDNLRLLIFDFPNVYLKQLERLLYPKWYAACFAKDYSNSSMWGHYADNHKGVCLVFETEATSQGNSLTLDGITGFGGNGKEYWGSSPRIFYGINYQDTPGEIDFFRSMGCVPYGELINLWFKGDDGSYSECGNYFGPNNDEKAWQKDYWHKFYRDITIKTNDWKYEQESRLIMSSMSNDLDEARQRTMTYHFKSLKSIIFGINTSNVDKLRIMETIHNKCQEHNLYGLEFSQAYYSHDERCIRKFP